MILIQTMDLLRVLTAYLFIVNSDSLDASFSVYIAKGRGRCFCKKAWKLKAQSGCDTKVRETEANREG